MAYSELANWDGGGSGNGNGMRLGEAHIRHHSNPHTQTQTHLSSKPQPRPHPHQRSHDINKTHSTTSTSNPTSSKKPIKLLDFDNRGGSTNSRPLSSLEIAMKANEEEMDEVEEVVFGLGLSDDVVVEDSEGEGLDLTGAKLLDRQVDQDGVNGSVQKSHNLQPRHDQEGRIRLLSPLTELTEESDMIETPVPSFIKSHHSPLSKKNSKSNLSQLASTSSLILSESDASREIRSSGKEKKRKRVEEKRNRKERSPSLPDGSSSRPQMKTNKQTPSKSSSSLLNLNALSRTTTFSTLSNATSFVSNNAEASSSSRSHQNHQQLSSSKPASGSSSKTISSDSSLTTKLDPTARSLSRPRYVFSHAYSHSPTSTNTNTNINGSGHFPSISPYVAQRPVGGDRQDSPRTIRAVSVISVRSRSDSPPTPKALLKIPPSQPQTQPQPQPQPQLELPTHSQSPLQSQSQSQSQSHPHPEHNPEIPSKRQLMDYILAPPFRAPYTKGAYRWVGGPQGMSGYFSDTNSEMSVSVRDKRDKGDKVQPGVVMGEMEEEEREVVDLMDVDDDDDDGSEYIGSEYGRKGKGRGSGRKNRYGQNSRSESSFNSRSRSLSTRGRKNKKTVDDSVKSIIDTKGKGKMRKERSTSRVSTSTRTSVSTKVNQSTKNVSKKKKSSSSNGNVDGRYADGDIVELVVDDDLTFCHQCRRKTTHDKMRCTSIFESGEKCGLRFCVRCITYRYPQITFTSYPSVFVCPKCTDTCNCTSCCAKRGEVYVSSGRGNNTRRIDEVMESMGLDVSEFKTVGVNRVQPAPRIGASASGGKVSTSGEGKKKKTQTRSVSKSRDITSEVVVERKLSPAPPLIDHEADNWIAARMVGRGIIRTGDDEEEERERKRPKIFIGAVQENWFESSSDSSRSNGDGDGDVNLASDSAGFSPRPRMLLKFSEMDCVIVNSPDDETDNLSGKGKGKERALSTSPRPRPRRRVYIGDPTNVSSKAATSLFDSIETFIQHQKLLYPELESAYTYDANGNRRSKRPRKPSSRVRGSGYGSEFEEEYEFEFGWDDGSTLDEDEDRWGASTSTAKGGKGKKGNKKSNGNQTRKANVNANASADGFVPEFTLNHASGSGTTSGIATALSSMTPLDGPNALAFLGITGSSSPVHEPTYTMDIEEHPDTFGDDTNRSNDRLAFIPWSIAGYEEYDAYNPLQAESSSQNLLTNNASSSSASAPLSHSSQLGLKMSDIFHEFEIGDQGSAESLTFPLNLTDQPLSLDNPSDYLPLTSFGDDDPIERVGSTNNINNDNNTEKKKLLEEGMTEEEVGRALNAAFFALQA